MNYLVNIADFASFLGALAALIFVFKGRRSDIHRGAKYLLAGLLALLLFQGFSNILEWTKLTAALDPFEDYVEILVPVLWVFFFYAFLQEAVNQQLEATNQQLLANDQQLRSANLLLAAANGQLVSSEQQLTATNQQLRVSKEETSALAKFPSENPNSVMRVAKDGSIIYANEASESLLDCWGCKIGEQLPDELCRIAGDAFNSGRSKEIDVDYECGSQSLTFAPVADLGYVNIYSLDITQRKKADEQLRQTRTGLEHAARLITAGEMAAGLAHELNQPLCAIVNYANAASRLIKTKGIEQDRLITVLNDVATQADRASEIIRRLRRLVKKRQPKQSSVNINEIVEEVIKLEHAEALEQGIEVLTELAENIQSVMADDIQIQQVILNLMRNGFEAMSQTPPENRRLTIRTSAVDRDKIEVAVCDNGKGISEDTAERIFDSFFSTRDEGLGVGLSLSRSIIESHGGKIWAEPNADCGAILRFTLPVKGTRNG
jgi:signal transduction histidine kinase